MVRSRCRRGRHARRASALNSTKAVSCRCPACNVGAAPLIQPSACRLNVRCYGGRWVSSLAARVPVAENANGLRVGASSELGTGWAHYLKTHRVMAFGRVDWLHRQQDVFNGTPVLVGGGHWLYLTPGIAVLVGKGLNVQADVKVPVYRDLANRQLDSRAIFQFGVSRSF